MMFVFLFAFYVLPINGWICKRSYQTINRNYMFDFNKETTLTSMSVSELLKEMKDRSVDDIYFSSDLRKIYSHHNALQSTNLNEYMVTYIHPQIVDKLITSASISNTQVSFVPAPIPPFDGVANAMNILGNVFTFSFYSYIILSIGATLLSFFTRTKTSGTPNPLSMLPSFGPSFNGKKDVERLKKLNISLKDWAGSPEIFEECTEVVSYLQNNTLYKEAGAELPRGILLEGPPGTGKTLIAKAIASECNASFISIASSEFVEVFVGLGAQKVRNLFEQARKNKPCILFIDEIDSIGKQRGTGLNINDEREQTLNQLLSEMDGFQSNEEVLIIAATNRRDVLDSALLRPGRFDRIITVPLPDKTSRKDIFRVHTRNKQLEEGIEFDFLAEISNGFSGAQIKNLINEAAISAARKGSKIITQIDLENSLEKIIIGITKKVEDRSNSTLRRVALHEAGHAFLAVYFRQYFELKKVSIQATYSGAGGFTLFLERPNTGEGGLYTKDLLKKRLIVAMGGKAAESFIYGEDFVSLGSMQDLKTANTLAKNMIGNYGMGEKLKVFYNENIDPMIRATSPYSETIKKAVDLECLELVKDAYQEAYNLLALYNDTVVHIANQLLQNISITGERIESLVNLSFRR